MCLHGDVGARVGADGHHQSRRLTGDDVDGLRSTDQPEQRVVRGCGRRDDADVLDHLRQEGGIETWAPVNASSARTGYDPGATPAGTVTLTLVSRCSPGGSMNGSTRRFCRPAVRAQQPHPPVQYLVAAIAGRGKA